MERHKVFPIAVNYDLSVEDAIKGNYDRVDENITSQNFPSELKGKAEIELIIFNYDEFMKTDKVIKNLAKDGLRTAELLEINAFAAMYPNVQRMFPIAALGFIWRAPYGLRMCACLGGDQSERCLFLNRIDEKWSNRFYFAAVPIEQ